MELSKFETVVYYNTHRGYQSFRHKTIGNVINEILDNRSDVCRIDVVPIENDVWTRFSRNSC